MTTSTDVIAKLQKDLVSIVPTTGVEHTAINVIAGILTVTADELGPLLEKKVDIQKLWEGLSNVESGIALTVQGGEEIAAAMKGPAVVVTPTPEATEGNA